MTVSSSMRFREPLLWGPWWFSVGAMQHPNNAKLKTRLGRILALSTTEIPTAVGVFVSGAAVENVFLLDRRCPAERFVAALCKPLKPARLGLKHAPQAALDLPFRNNLGQPRDD